MTFFPCPRKNILLTLDMCAARPCSRKCRAYRERVKAVERGDAEQVKGAKGMKKIMEMI